MGLVDEILAWAAKDLKPWQSDAVRRLFGKPELDEADQNELLSMLLQSRGLSFPDAAVVTPIPLAAEHLPEDGGKSPPTALLGMKNLVNVNRLTSGQELTFKESGFTGIFGDNGAGKSGYARVVKAACRARVKDEPVLADARNPDAKKLVPEATFVVKRSGVTSEVTWKANQPAPQELASVAILDTRCARAYTDSEGELIFAPWGLDVVERLASKVYPKLDDAVKAMAAALPISDQAFADLKSSPTKVGKFLLGLGHKTSDAEVDAICKFDEQQAQELKNAEQALAEKSPAERATSLRQEATRLDGVSQTLRALSTIVSDEELQRLAAVDNEAVQAVEAQRVAAQHLRGEDQMLDGTGDIAWKGMFAAAKRFMTAHAHTADEGRPCALCQTPLSPDAAVRWERFEKYLLDDASQRASRALEAQELNFSKLERSEVGSAAIDQATLEQLEKLDSTWPETKNTYLAELATRKTWALAAAAHSHDWSACPPVTSNPTLLPTRQAEALRAQAAALDLAAGDTNARQQLERTRDELNAAQSLTQRKDALVALLDAKRKAEKLNGCIQDLRTRPVSDKAAALATSAVTQQLVNALNEEFRKLDVTHLQTTLKARNEKGRTKVKLAMGFAASHRPDEILSEGEQRIIAIASFFAELGLSGNSGPAVFDDPVSSLDHVKRQFVARRLVEESARRQVIVFTHDTVFLAELMDALDSEDVQEQFRHLTYARDAAGRVNAGLPWRHQGVPDRIDKLEKHARQLAQEASTADSEVLARATRDGYSRLREVIERAVEEVLFGSVVNRYSDYIRVNNLEKAAGLTSAECAPFMALYTEAGDIISGHDKASGRGFAPPSPEKFSADVAALRAAVDTVKTRRKPAKT